MTKSEKNNPLSEFNDLYIVNKKQFVVNMHNYKTSIIFQYKSNFEIEIVMHDAYLLATVKYDFKTKELKYKYEHQNNDFKPNFLKSGVLHRVFEALNE